jgi:transcriptional regulator with XRE-family HTH domain
MDIAKIIGKNLTALMEAPAPLDTCQKLAAKSGVSFGTIQRIKNGEVNITVEKLTKIAIALKQC